MSQTNLPVQSFLLGSQTRNQNVLLETSSIRATYGANLQSSKIIEINNNVNDLLQQQQKLFVNENFTSKRFERKIPISSQLNKGYQNFKYSFTTEGWTKPEELLFTFQVPIAYKTSQIANIQTNNASQWTQSPYCFLNSLYRVEGFMGNLDTNLIPDQNIQSNIIALKSIMACTPKNISEKRTDYTLGLPCTKTNPLFYYTDIENQLIYDNFLNAYTTLNYYNTPATAATGNAIVTCTMSLKNLFPFLDTNQMLPPNTKFSFIMNFRISKIEQSFLIGGDRFLPYFGQAGYIAIDDSAENYPISIDNCLPEITYYSYEFNNNIIDRQLTLPSYYLYNSWSYQLDYQQVNANQSTYSYMKQLVFPPTSIILYFTYPAAWVINQNDPSIVPDTNFSNLQNDGNGYLGGVNINSLKIFIDGVEVQSVVNTYINNSWEVNAGVGSFNTNLSAFDVHQNLVQSESWDDGKSLSVLQSMNMVENIKPIELFISPDQVNKKNIRPLMSSTNSNLRIEFSIKNNIIFNATDLSSPQTVINGLPIGTSINVLFKYPVQYVIDKDSNAFYISQPLIFEGL